MLTAFLTKEGTRDIQTFKKVCGMNNTYDLSRFFTYSLDMLCIAGFDGYFKCINPAFEHWLGWKTEDLLSRPFVDFVHPEDQGPTLEQIRRISSGEICVSFENRYQRFDGSWVWMMWTSYPDMERDLMYAVARDITDRKHRELRQEKELASALSTLEKLGELLPICSYCKNIRSDEGYWKRIECFLEESMEQRLTHSICPQCAEQQFSKFLEKKNRLPHP